MRIFVTGDNHIGKMYAGHEKRKELVEERINAIWRMVKKANEEGCALFAVTGDLFENVSSVALKHIKAVADAFSEFNGRVVILPGNHDYYTPDAKVWKDFISISADKDNIAVMTEYLPYEFDVDDETAVIYPAFCDRLHSEPGENRLDWIKKENFPADGKIRIGMAHGTVEGEALDNEGKYFVMTRGELNAIPVDVWLIGHTHRPFPNDLTEEYSSQRERIFNAGTHVQTDVSNNTEGTCFIIEIDKQKNIRAKKYVSGGIHFYRKNVVLTAGNMARELADELKDLGDNSVVDLIFSGAVSHEEYADRRETIEKSLERFLESSYNDSGLTRLITRDLVEEKFPIETSFARKMLADLLDDPKEAQLAYELIMSVREEK